MPKKLETQSEIDVQEILDRKKKKENDKRKQNRRRTTIQKTINKKKAQRIDYQQQVTEDVDNSSGTNIFEQDARANNQLEKGVCQSPNVEVVGESVIIDNILVEGDPQLPGTEKVKEVTTTKNQLLENNSFLPATGRTVTQMMEGEVDQSRNKEDRDPATSNSQRKEDTICNYVLNRRIVIISEKEPDRAQTICEPSDPPITTQNSFHVLNENQLLESSETRQKDTTPIIAKQSSHNMETKEKSSQKQPNLTRGKKVWHKIQ